MTIPDMQKEIYRNKLDKHFNVTDLHIEFCSLYGEVAEAYEAWWKHKDSFGEELADVAIFLLGIAEITGVDLEREIEAKMEKNRRRSYEMIDGVLTRTAGD